MAKRAKASACDMEVLSFVAEGVRVFTNKLSLGDDTTYAWEIVNPITKKVALKQPFTTNPCFAYPVDKYENMNVVARVKGDVEFSCVVLEAPLKPIEGIKVMYARRSNFFRFTNITDIDGLTFTWQLQAKPSSKRLWKDVEGVEGNGSRAFEYTFEEGCDYRVIACISTDDGGYGSRVVAEITAEDLQTPKFF